MSDPKIQAIDCLRRIAIAAETTARNSHYTARHTLWIALPVYLAVIVIVTAIISGIMFISTLPPTP